MFKIFMPLLFFMLPISLISGPIQSKPSTKKNITKVLTITTLKNKMNSSCLEMDHPIIIQHPKKFDIHQSIEKALEKLQDLEKNGNKDHTQIVIAITLAYEPSPNTDSDH